VFGALPRAIPEQVPGEIAEGNLARRLGKARDADGSVTGGNLFR
jgi:hypothetical protein